MLRVFAAVIAIAGLLSGCGSPERWTLGSPMFYPTALDYWPESRAFLVGSYHDGSIQRMAFDGPAAQELFQEKHADGRRKALRLKVDRAANRLWVLDVDAVYIYTLPEKRLIRRIALPESVLSRDDCLPDIVVTSTGAAFISDARRPVLYMISENAIEQSLERTDIAIQFAGGEEHRDGFSALMENDNPFALIAGSASAGKLWRIDPTTGKADAISTPPLKGICGMSTITPEVRPYLFYPTQMLIIYITTGFSNQILGILLTRDLQRGEVRRIAGRTKVETPVSLVAFRSHILVANSQLSRHKDFNGGDGPVVPFRLVPMASALELVIRIDR